MWYLIYILISILLVVSTFIVSMKVFNHEPLPAIIAPTIMGVGLLYISIFFFGLTKEPIETRYDLGKFATPDAYIIQDVDDTCTFFIDNGDFKIYEAKSGEYRMRSAGGDAPYVIIKAAEHRFNNHVDYYYEFYLTDFGQIQYLN